MRRRAVPASLVVSLAVLVGAAGCGDGDDDGSRRSSTPAVTTTGPPPSEPTQAATFTVEQLGAALPTQADLPAGVEAGVTCPGDADVCDRYPEGLAVVELSVEPASPEGAARVQDQATPLDFGAVQGEVYPDDAGAAAAVEEATSGGARYDGSYELTEGGRTTRGEGSTQPATYGLWTGSLSWRSEVSSDAATDEGLLVASIALSSGSTRVGAFVSLSAAGRDRGAAAELADRLVRDYLERLDPA